MKTLFRFSLASLLLAIAIPAAAAPKIYTSDLAHSEVGFTIRHLVSKVHGKFDTFKSTIVYDAADPTASSVETEIETKSINTGQARRDNHLRSPDFFLADSFPKITFKSTSITKKGDRFQVAGDLTIRGITKPVVLDAALLGIGPGMMGGEVAGFEGTTRVSRKDFGVSWNKALDQGGLLLGNDVDITLNIEAGAGGPRGPGGK